MPFAVHERLLLSLRQHFKFRETRSFGLGVKCIRGEMCGGERSGEELTKGERKRGLMNEGIRSKQ